VVTLTATDHAFEAPDTIPAGFTTFRMVNNSDQFHMAQLIKAHSLVVRANGATAASRTAPESGVVIRLVEYRFSISAPLTAGRHMIRVENMGAEPHEVGLVKLAPGKTRQDREAWLKNLEGPPPASSVGGVSSLAANTEAYFEADLAPGDYVFFCLVTAPDGRPHTAHGMIQHIRIG
jgi:hypothetical protein